MIRREFIKKSGVAATAVASSAALGQSQPKPPNVVIVHCDELNFRTIGCYRDTLSPEQGLMWGPDAACETPHIDSIAKEGAICTKFYAATPVCSPSRSSLLSGQYPQHTPVTNNSVHMSDDVVTFAHQFGKADYRTGYAGKWHLDGEGKPQWAPERNFGFDDNRYMFNRGHWKQFELTPEGPRVKARDKKGEPSYSVAGADEKSFATDWLTDRTIDFIQEGKADEPFVYMVSIPDPHGPDTVRAPYDSMYDDADVQKPRTFDKDPDSAPSWAKPEPKCHFKMAQYNGMMKCIDDNVGRLIAAMKEAGVYDNTIFIFTADHGDMRGEHHRQNKGVPMEASGKIPFVIRWPKGIPAGTQIDHAMNTTDFMPTILAMCNVEETGKEQGRDLSEIFGGGKLKAKDVTFMRGTTKSAEDTSGWVAAVTPTHKLILSSQDESWLLNLEKDPDELTNVIKDTEEQDTVRFLARQLDRYGRENGDAKLTNPNTRATLDALLR
ncbi:MAG: sulfatase [Verrucomicrobiales bacterium]|nr:sulfatase [Verrucomicrobiales bacterium]